MLPDPALLVVAGPTASGKSALALALARRLRGTVINADAMQCHAALRVLTARPPVLDEALVPHRLYGVLRPGETGGVGWWRIAASAAIAESRAEGRLPILCGGTGLYIHALLYGLAEIPPPGEAARVEARALVAELGVAGLHARLAVVDPQTASRLRPSDPQRVGRAWEVWRGTGMGLAAWQARSAALPSAVPAAQTVLLLPPLSALQRAVRRRWAAMLRDGALDEVRALLARRLDAAHPAMRAHGVPELASALRGERTMAEASEAAVTAICRYVKRQRTWWRHHTSRPMICIHALWTGHAQLSDNLCHSAAIFFQGMVD